MKTILSIFKWLGIVLAGLIAISAVVYLFLPKRPKEIVNYKDNFRTAKPLLQKNQFAAVTGTPWATQAAITILNNGGNAYDAAVAALLALNVTNSVHSSFPCEAPTMIYDGSTQQVRSYIGAGKAPSGATIEAFKKKGWETVPPSDIWSQLVPASPDVMIALLKEYGTMSFADVAAPAIQIARDGFPAHPAFIKDLNSLSLVERLGLTIIMPYNAEYYLHKQWWRPLFLNERIRFPDLANTFQQLAEAEQAVLAKGGTRQDGLQAVRDEFYKGSLAEKILALQKEKGGLINQTDLVNYSGGWETPVTGSYGEYTFYTNGGWTQGMVDVLTLQILEGIDLKAMGHNSPEYIHTVAQAIELAQADRDAYVGDPAFVDVPIDELMSKAYAAQRRGAMTNRAFGPLPAPGSLSSASNVKPVRGEKTAQISQKPDNPFDIRIGQDTTQLAIIDKQGNAVVMTPSDFPWTPMVPGTGINLGNRMNQFRLDPSSPDALAPGKRPRITPHAVIVFKNGKFYMAYSTPGGDMQPQALVQVFLNMQVFGMNVEDAISAPRFYDITAPSSFAPHEASPGTLRLESDLYDSSAEGLQALGYTLVKDPNWNMDYGGVGALVRGEDGSIYVGADPRWETWGDGS